MVDHATPQGTLSVEEYLKLEEASSVKHEYVAGEIHAMVGASRRHNLIVGNLSSSLWNAARNGSCRVYSSDMKLRAAEDVYYYPDVMVVCGPEPEDPYTEYEPCLVVEVISPSTEATDRREKLAAYKKMPSVQAYLIVAQDRPWVERHWRGEDGVWRRADLVDPEGVVPIPFPETAVTVSQVYTGL